MGLHPPPWLLSDDPDRLLCRSSQIGRNRCGIDPAPGRLNQPLDQFLRPDNKSALNSHSLAQSTQSNLKRQLAQTERFHHARPMGAKKTSGMGFIHDHHGLKPLGQSRQFDQRCSVSIHAENRLGDDQPPTISTLISIQNRFQTAQIIMRKDLQSCP